MPLSAQRRPFPSAHGTVTPRAPTRRRNSDPRRVENFGGRAPGGWVGGGGANVVIPTRGGWVGA